MEHQDQLVSSQPRVKPWFSGLLLLGCLFLMFLPFLQEQSKVFWIYPLRGSYVPAKRPTRTLETFWNGTYQDSFNIWHNENFGFRNTLVRVHNQFDFSFFRVSHADDVLIGKEDYLYELQYAQAWHGPMLTTRERLLENVHKLRVLQDTLAAQGITLLVGLAPSKAHFYPEYLPTKYAEAGPENYYLLFRDNLAKEQVNVIDFNQWCIQKKNKDPNLIFPKTGTHWSRYASTLAVDTLIRWIEQKRHIDMANLKFGPVVMRDSLKEPDQDIENALNLLWPIPKPLMSYPSYTVEDTVGKQHPRVLVISDSFFWSMFDMHVIHPCDYWYYNQDVYDNYGGHKYARDLNGSLETQRHEVIIIMATDPNIPSIGWGYIDQIYNFFVLKKATESRDMLAAQYERYMRQDPQWMKTLQDKAAEKKISLEEMMHLDALYMADQDLAKLKQGK